MRLYRLLPLKAMSRLWGRLNGVDLPEWLRPPLYKLYIWAFGVNLDEAAVKDLRFYRNLGEFFRRPLARAHRPVDQQHTLVRQRVTATLLAAIARDVQAFLA